MSVEEIEARGGFPKMPNQRRREPDAERDFAYSEWHRPGSLARFMTITQAVAQKMMDLDGVEINAATNTPCAYIETTEESVETKHTRWTKTVSTGHPAPGYVVQIVLSDAPNPACQWGPVKDIERFMVKNLATGEARKMDPQQYADFLISRRE